MGIECLDNLVDPEFYESLDTGKGGEGYRLPLDPIFAVHLKRMPSFEIHEEQPAVRAGEEVQEPGMLPLLLRNDELPHPTLVQLEALGIRMKDAATINGCNQG